MRLPGTYVAYAAQVLVRLPSGCNLHRQPADFVLAWGVRHVSDAIAKETAARNRDGSGLTFTGSEPFGLTFSLNEPSSTVVVRYLSKHESPQRGLTVRITALGPEKHSPVRVIAPGVAEVTFRDRAESWSYPAISALMGWVFAPIDACCLTCGTRRGSGFDAARVLLPVRLGDDAGHDLFVSGALGHACLPAC